MAGNDATSLYRPEKQPCKGMGDTKSDFDGAEEVQEGSSSEAESAMSQDEGAVDKKFWEQVISIGMFTQLLYVVLMQY